MFEIATTSTRYSVAALNRATGRICRYVKRGNEMGLAIAFSIAETANLWNSDDSPAEFANVHEWTKDAFGISKTQSYDLLNVGKRFVRKTENGNGFHSTLLPDDYADFNITQLTLFLKYDDETLAEFIENGVINPTMTIAEIKKALKTAEGDTESGESEENESGESGESEETETVTLTTDDGEKITIPRKVFDKLIDKYGN